MKATKDSSTAADSRERVNGEGSTGEMIPAAEISISRFLAVAVSWWSEGRLPGRVDFWKKEGEARYSCLEHPSAQEAQGAKGQGWGDGDGGGGAIGGFG